MKTFKTFLETADIITPGDSDIEGITIFYEQDGHGNLLIDIEHDRFKYPISKNIIRKVGFVSDMLNDIATDWREAKLSEKSKLALGELTRNWTTVSLPGILFTTPGVLITGVFIPAKIYQSTALPDKERLYQICGIGADDPLRAPLASRFPKRNT